MTPRIKSPKVSTSSSVIISKTFTIKLDHFLVSDVVATKRAWVPLRKLHRFPQMNTDTWMFKITKKRLTECMVSVTEPTGDLRVRVAVVAAARWVTISVTAPTSSKTYSTRHRGSTVTLTYQHLKPLEK